MKKSDKPNNKYSFFTVKKSHVVDPIHSDSISKSEETINNDDFLDIEVYSFKDDKIIQEYCFETNDSLLYFDTGNDDELALVYESEFNSTENVITHYIYQTDGIFTAIQQNDGKFSSILYMDAKNFQKLNNKCERSIKMPIIEKINTHMADVFVERKTKIVATQNKVVDDENSSKLYERFKDLFKKYSLASNYLPATCTIETILEIINHYIATKELDKDTLLANYAQLQNFQEICPSSIVDISQFIQDPSNTDLRNLCDALNKRLKNLESFINLYLEKELKDDLEK